MLMLISRLAAWLLCTTLAIAAPPAPGEFGSALPDGLVQGGGVNLTTARAAERLGALIRAIDVPLRGARIQPPVHVYDAPGTWATAMSNRSGIWVPKVYLEQLSGVKISATDPGSVDRAVNAALASGKSANRLGFMLAHELGHLAKGHPQGPAIKTADAPYRREAVAVFESAVEGLDGDEAAVIARLQAADRATASAGPRRMGAIRNLMRAEEPKAYPPILFHHLSEYQADEHAVLTTFQRTGSLRRTLDGMNSMGDPTGPGAVLFPTHPSKTARVLAALDLMERHPDVFGSGPPTIEQVRVERGVPPLKVIREGGRIRVEGREAVLRSLSPIERELHSTLRDARWAAEPEATTGLIRRAGRTSMAEMVRDGFQPRWLSDAARGAATTVAITAGAQIGAALLDGSSPIDAVTQAVHTVTSREFLASMAGAAVGSGAVQVLQQPAASLSPLGAWTRSLPALTAGFVSAELAARAVALSRSGNLTAMNLLRSVDWLALGAQIAGSSLGATLAMGAFGPGLLIGGVAVIPVLGGVAGGVAALKLLEWARRRVARMGDAVIARHSRGDGAAPLSPRAAATWRPDPTDPFSTLPLAPSR